jgi:hypothetical protein
MPIGLFVIVLLVLLLVAALPVWSYSRDWGTGPSRAVSLVAVGVTLLLLVLGKVFVR